MVDPPTPDTNEPAPGPVEPVAQLVAEEPRFEMSMQAPEPTPEPDPMPEPMPGPQEMRQSYQPSSCVNCAHMPMGVNTVVSVLVALVFTLSSLVVASAMVIDSQSFQLKAYNGGASSVAHR